MSDETLGMTYRLGPGPCGVPTTLRSSAEPIPAHLRMRLCGMTDVDGRLVVLLAAVGRRVCLMVLVLKGCWVFLLMLVVSVLLAAVWDRALCLLVCRPVDCWQEGLPVLLGPLLRWMPMALA